MSAWGQQTWGLGYWGLLGDATATPSTNVISASTGSVTLTGEINTGWGRDAWGNQGWGILGTLIANGNQTTSAVGSVTVDAQIQIGWGGLYWGAGEWGELTSPEVQLTGQQLSLTTNAVSITANADVFPTGIEKTVTLEGGVAGTSVLIDNLTGLSATASEGDAFGGELVVVEVTSPSNDEWGTEAWGNGFWGVGDGLTVFVSGETEHIADANVFPTSATITGSLGETVVPVTIDNGIELSLTQGDAFGGELVEVQVTTASAAPWGEVGFGEGQWGQSVGTDISQGGEEVAVPSVEVDVTGIPINSNTGDESVTGDANLTLTGSALDLQLGNEDAFTNVRVNVSGNDIGTIVIGDFLAGISILVEPTGVTATTNTGTIGLNAWAVVDPNGATTWTVVDLAA